MRCYRKYTPAPKPQGYYESLRKRAAERYVDGMNLRKIARRLKVHYRTIAFWVVDRAVRDAEMDEPFTCISEKKTGSPFVQL